MSTIFGILSLKQKVSELEFLKMKQAMPCMDYQIYEDEQIRIATTEKISDDGKRIFSGRLRFQELDIDHLNVLDADGHFIYIEKDKNQINVYKDALGIASFYYYYQNECLYFASEIKGILAIKEHWIIDEEGIKQVLCLLPALDPHQTPYQGIQQLAGGECLTLAEGIEINRWWDIPKFDVPSDKNNIIDDLKKIVSNAILDDAKEEASCMLSGGLDSSVIVSVVSQTQKPKTYDVTYEKQEKYFKGYDYQTTMDKPYIEAMKEKYSIDHQTIRLSQEELVNHLKDVLYLRDLPGMVDIDSSLLLFCQAISKNNNIVLSGECADEFFGGYPWFYKKELQNTPYFPWNRHVKEKEDLFLFDLNVGEYLKKKRDDTCKDLNVNKKNEIMYLTMQWFMQTLVKRGDVIGRACHLDIRMPFASKTVFEYLWNVNEKDFYEEGKEKVLLREAFKDLLPKEVYERKKNPYPKTHSPEYTDLVVQLLQDALLDPTSVLHRLFKKEALDKLILTKGSSFQYPWYGQLMTGPQLIAFIYTIHLWEKLYPIDLIL